MSKTGSNIIYNCERSEPYLSPKKIFDFFNLDILIYFVIKSYRVYALDIACRGGGWVYLYMKGSQMKCARITQYKTKDKVCQRQVVILYIIIIASAASHILPIKKSLIFLA